MNVHAGEIGAVARRNTHYRHVIFTAPHSQLVVMCLQPGEQIGSDSHAGLFRLFQVESGEARVVLGDSQEERLVLDGEHVLVPRDVVHNVINASKTALLKLYSIVSPPTHADETVHRTKADADAAARAHVSSPPRLASAG